MWPIVFRRTLYSLETRFLTRPGSNTGRQHQAMVPRPPSPRLHPASGAHIHTHARSNRARRRVPLRGFGSLRADTGACSNTAARSSQQAICHPRCVVRAQLPVCRKRQPPLAPHFQSVARPSGRMVGHPQRRCEHVRKHTHRRTTRISSAA